MVESGLLAWREAGRRQHTRSRLHQQLGAEERTLSFDPKICRIRTEPYGLLCVQAARPAPREPDAPGATRGLPPTCPRMASPALTGPRPGQTNRIKRADQREEVTPMP